MADFVYEIACTGDQGQEAAVQAWAERHAAPAWLALPGLTAVDLYRPLRGGTHDPFNDDGPGPLLMAMLQFPTKEKLQAGLSDPRFKQSLAGMPVAATGTGFERRFFPVADAPNPGPLRAPFSYVVRYHHPAENVAEFVSHYVADHPPILGKLPEIRSVLCYLPVDAGVVRHLAAGRLHDRQRSRVRFAGRLQCRDGVAGAPRIARAFQKLPAVHRQEYALPDDAPAVGG